MGLFSSKKTTYVSSSTYPIGDDDPDTLVNYQKYVVLNAVLQNRNISNSVTSSYLAGQGMKLRNAYRYARDHYHLGLPHSGAQFVNSPDKVRLREILSAKHGKQEIFLSMVLVAQADFTFWAERYLTETYGYDRLLKLFIRPPEGVAQDANVTYDIEKDGLIRILLMNPDGSSKVLDFRPKDLQSQTMYVHTVYRTIHAFPTEHSTVTRPTQSGDEDRVSTSVSIVDRVGESQETTIKTTMTVAGGSTTITTEKSVRTMSRPQYFLYRMGTGTYPDIDAWLVSSNVASSPYFPSVPLRVDNVDYTHGSRKDHPLYKTSKKLLNRVGLDINKLGDQLRDNPQINEVDFAYVQFGISLNTKTQACKRYAYRFFEQMRSVSFHSKAEWEAWEAAFADQHAAAVASGSADVGGYGELPPDVEDGGGLGGTVPSRGAGDNPNQGYTTPPLNTLKINHPGMSTTKKESLDVELHWQFIDTQQIQGQAFPGAKPGDCTIETGAAPAVFRLLVDIMVDGSTIYARRQIDEDTYEEMAIKGLVFTNNAYQHHKVQVTAYDALTKEDEEGFILPLSQIILRQMNIKDTTQLSYDCLHIVINTYQVVKKKWYQRGWFKYLLIIIAIVIMVFFPPAGVVALSQVIMTTLVITSVTLALLIAAVLTIFAQMILAKILLKAGTELFGEEWGPVVAMIAMVFLQQSFAGGSFDVTAIAQMSAMAILQSTAAVYGAYVSGQLSKVAMDIQTLQKESDDFSKKMTELNKQLALGTSVNMIDLEGYAQAQQYIPESHDIFLKRTLVTGSDVVEMTHGLIADFAEVGLQLPTTG
jgi:hypothetical protein